MVMGDGATQGGNSRSGERGAGQASYMQMLKGRIPARSDGRMTWDCMQRNLVSPPDGDVSAILSYRGYPGT